MNTNRALCSLVLLFLLGLSQPGQAQWLTQTNALRPGWNAVFLHVDASHATLDELVGSDDANPIEEIWVWHPPLPTGQFIESPQLPTGSGSRWSSWSRLLGPASALQRLQGNVACLVRVSSNSGPYQWRLKGAPVPPTYQWTLTGLNFIGFPTPSGAPPTFDSFFAPAPELQQSAEIYRYQGGEFGPTNPVRLLAFRTTQLARDQAYWIRAGDSYNRYFGPFQIVQADRAGIRYGDNRSQATFRIRNVMNGPLTVSLRQVASEAAPAGQPDVAGATPLLLRGALNTTNLTYGYTSLASGAQSWSLAPAGQPGSEVDVIIGLNRTQMAGAPGTFYAGVLQLTDSLNLAQVNLGVSAEVASSAGLWVGAASVGFVSHYLKTYARATNRLDFTNLLTRLQLGQGVEGYRYQWDETTGRVLVFGGPNNNAGSYLLEGPVRVDSGEVARPFPLRLIVHNNGASSVLLQRAYHGFGVASNLVVATRQSALLGSELARARRLSAVHLPASAGNIPWSFTGSMQPGGSLSTTVHTAHDDQGANPFLHTYHPDHDSLDAFFATPQPQGVESYGVSRQIALNFTMPGNDFESVTRGGLDFSGNYAEVVTFRARGNQTQQFNVLGTFTLKKISDIATLTTQ